MGRPTPISIAEEESLVGRVLDPSRHERHTTTKITKAIILAGSVCLLAAAGVCTYHIQHPAAVQELESEPVLRLDEESESGAPKFGDLDHDKNGKIEQSELLKFLEAKEKETIEKVSKDVPQDMMEMIEEHIEGHFEKLEGCILGEWSKVDPKKTNKIGPVQFKKLVELVESNCFEGEEDQAMLLDADDDEEVDDDEAVEDEDEEVDDDDQAVEDEDDEAVDDDDDDDEAGDDEDEEVVEDEAEMFLEGDEDIPDMDGTPGPDDIPDMDGTSGPDGIPDMDGTPGPDDTPDMDDTTGPDGTTGPDDDADSPLFF